MYDIFVIDYELIKKSIALICLTVFRFYTNYVYKSSFTILVQSSYTIL